ncbi:hypothetical protein EGW08_021685 [Elysia chlorotica]|uniref:WAP domain-containing protein n=1 Tax=Elysia chlorotica TaxID=188477 RepID=A0A433SMZ9_ELYCH|nr:hypothetical protein EGW08_021685 [Elysia chlorotica]
MTATASLTNPPTVPPESLPIVPPYIPPVIPPKPLPIIPQTVTQQQMGPNLLSVFFAASLANNFNFYRQLLSSSQANQNLNKFSPASSSGPLPSNLFASPGASQPMAQNNEATLAMLNMTAPRRRGDTNPDPPTTAPPNSTATVQPVTTPMSTTFPKPVTTAPPTFSTSKPTVPTTIPPYTSPVITTPSPYIPPAFPTSPPYVPPLLPSFPVPSPLLQPAVNVTIPPAVSKPGPCGLLRCPLGSVCRLLVDPLTRTTSVQCVDSFRLKPGVDIDCNNQMYLMALLMPTNTMSGVEPMECKDPSFYNTCPVGATCVANSRTGRFTCCAGSPDHQGVLTMSSRVDTRMVQKAGTCPAGNTFVCGGTPCKSDFDCEGIQKCCDGCGKFCTNPVVVPPADGCGGCPYRHSCIPQPTRTCPPGRSCVQSLHLPTCVPNECLACHADQFCQKVGAVCSEQRAEDQAENLRPKLLQSMLLSAYPALRQLQPPPPCRDLYQCAPKDNCGGCPLGQQCEMTKIVCVSAPCTASFRCVAPQVRQLFGADR